MSSWTGHDLITVTLLLDPGSAPQPWSPPQCGAAPSTWWPPSPFLLGPPPLGRPCPWPPASGVAGPRVSQGSPEPGGLRRAVPGRTSRAVVGGRGPVPCARAGPGPGPSSSPWPHRGPSCSAASVGGEACGAGRRSCPLRPHVILSFEAGFVLSVLFPGWKPLRLLPQAPLQRPPVLSRLGGTAPAPGGSCWDLRPPLVAQPGRR